MSVSFNNPTQAIAYGWMRDHASKRLAEANLALAILPEMDKEETIAFLCDRYWAKLQGALERALECWEFEENWGTPA
jgi:hypothetical protein